MPNTRARISAFAAVTFRRLLIARSRAYAERPSLGESSLRQPHGLMNSSTKISPTVAGFRFVVSMVASSIAVVVEIEARASPRPPSQWKSPATGR